MSGQNAIHFACDSLIERKFNTELFEAILELNPEGRIFTFAHQPKGLIGPVTSHPVTSTFMSKFLKRPLSKSKWRYLAPFAGQKFEARHDIEKLLVFSEGLAPYIKVVGKNYQTIIYHYGLEIDRPTLGDQPETKHLASSFFVKMLLQSEAKSDLEVEVVYPYINVAEFIVYPLDRKSDRPIVLTTDNKFDQFITEKGYEPILVKDACDGDLAHYLKDAALVIQSTQADPWFNALALKCQMMGVPCLSVHSPINLELLGADLLVNQSGGDESWRQAIVFQLEHPQTLEQKRAWRKNAGQFSPIKFHHKLVQFI